MLADDPISVARPFLWLAAIGFVFGFLGYLLLGQPHAVSTAHAQPDVTQVDTLAMARDIPRDV